MLQFLRPPPEREPPVRVAVAVRANVSAARCRASSFNLLAGRPTGAIRHFSCTSNMVSSLSGSIHAVMPVLYVWGAQTADRSFGLLMGVLYIYEYLSQEKNTVVDIRKNRKTCPKETGIRYMNMNFMENERKLLPKKLFGFFNLF